MTKNLIISNGYYTTITAISILKQLNLASDANSLLAYFKNLNNNSFNENINLSYKAWKFVKIFDFNKFYNSNKFLFDLFKKDLNEDNIQNILIPINSTTKKWYHGFKKYYPDANYIFFEEGLISYVIPIFDLKLSNIISKYSCYYNDFNNNFLVFISNNFKNVNVFNTIDRKYFRDTLNDLDMFLDINFYYLNNSRNVLFLPQYYHNTNKSSNFKKLKNYTTIIKTLLDKGYRVLIKDHPKENLLSLENFLKIYLDDKKNIVYLNNIKQFPVEIFLNKLNVDFIFSVYSTTLISASSKLFNLPVFTYYDMLQERINSFSLYPSITSLLVKKVIPDIKNFFSHYNDNALQYYNNYIINNKNDLANLTFFKLMLNFLLKI